jgi:hypothetical protein
VRIPRDREQAQRTAGSPTPLGKQEGQYRWSSVFPALYSVDFETALVRIALDDGTIGWGEAQAPLAPEVACAIIDRLLCPVLRGAEFDGTLECVATLWDSGTGRLRAEALAARRSGVQPVTDIGGCVADELADLAIPRSLALRPPITERGHRDANPSRHVAFVQQGFDWLVAHFACALGASNRFHTPMMGLWVCGRSMWAMWAKMWAADQTRDFWLRWRSFSIRTAFSEVSGIR